jgi:RNA polymerase sigma factor (sigma-70 family)
MRVAVGRTQAEVAIAGRPARGDAATEARVVALLTRHEASLLRVARQWSICQDDAYDALQRGLEIYVRRIATIDRATEAAWLKVVIRHEALAIRRARGDAVPAELDFDSHVAAEERSVEDQVLSSDRVSRSAEALRGLKPDEARALMLKAHGFSYEEIARRCGWTYTKVNRAITEGRRRFLALYGSLETGEECERFAPILQALATGRATSEQLVEARPHLRRCPACRATVRDLHLSGLHGLRVLGLPAIVAPWRWVREHMRRGGAPTRSGPLEFTPLHGPRLPRPDAPPFARMRDRATALLHRTNSSDLAASIHIAATTGGGRAATIGTIVGLCLSGIGAGTVCVVTGVMHAPFGLLDQRHGAVVRAHPRSGAVGRAKPAPTLAADTAALRVAPTPTPTPRPPTHRRAKATRTVHPVATATPTAAPAASADPAQGTTPTSQEHAPVSPAPSQPSTTEFAASPSSGTGTSTPAASAPATGGEEFSP